ncbi:polysaccharide biosynthesis protein [Solibacillus sp. MA9]|uniref:Polysaccharide biosynthesis protein n=1 Tax=Solibacillus palustris TaxID=2908203 RepID=A0ABS9UHP8_9BACL|nr:polysaccharide biosynthesis protein [Solibacillus sp. MA9]MCH7323868.1 polysaccharide biosynthesis protein [Solibacillus sp. MA9]
MSSQNFGMKNYMKGALLLTMAALIVKILSAIYRVPYQNLVGDQGFYVYQQVYPFISFFVVWTSSGFAVAISKMLADIEARGGTALEKRAVSWAIFKYLMVLSLIFFSLLFFGADALAALMNDAELAGLLKMGSFVTLCMPLLALLKGTFQANSYMQPVAYAQVFEQAIRVAIILVGTIVLLQFTTSVYTVGKMAVLGTVIGEVAGIILLFLFLKREQQPIAKKKVAVWPILKEVTLYSIAISMGALLLLCFQLVDSFTIFKMLVASGMEIDQAMEVKGIYDRGQPLVQLGIVIATSLSLAIVPLVALKAKAKNGRGAKPFIQLTYRSSLLFGVAAALGLVLVMPYANTLLFKTDSYSNMLRLYVVQIVPLSIILTFMAVLQGYSKLKMPALFLLISIALKYIGNVVLIPHLDVLGAAIASTVGLIFAAIALVIYMKKIAVSRLATAMFYRKLLVASIVMIVTITCAVFLLDIVFTAPEMRRSVALIYSGILVSLGAFSFITVVAKLRVLTEKDWFLIPFGRRMAMYQLWLNRKK